MGGLDVVVENGDGAFVCCKLQRAAAGHAVDIIPSTIYENTSVLCPVQPTGCCKKKRKKSLAMDESIKLIMECIFVVNYLGDMNDYLL